MFVITMAGMSRRFSIAGYDKPKYALPLWGQTLFDWSVASFKRYFNCEKFVFSVLADGFSKDFVNTRAKACGICDFEIVEMRRLTRGQAESAMLAVAQVPGDMPLFIFNIDTLRYNFEIPPIAAKCDGYLEVFHGEGEHWSFAEVNARGQVLRTSEKQRISDLCSDGLYFFASKNDFCDLVRRSLTQPDLNHGEYYVAPLYNHMIAADRDIRFTLVPADQIDFCGMPEEYSYLLERGPR